MALSFDKEKGIVTIRLDGVLGEAAILGAFDEAVAHPEHVEGMARLWDFRSADLTKLETRTIASMARHSQTYGPGINDVRVAFAVARAVEYGLTRMFQGRSADARTTIEVFRTIEEAEDWLSRGA